MKKLLLMLAAIAAFSFTACTGSAEGEAQDADTSALTVEQFQEQLNALIEKGDTTEIQNLLTKSQDEVAALLAKGDTVGAQGFLDKVKEIINTNKEKLVALAPSLGAAVDKAAELPAGLKEVAVAAVDSAKNAVADAAADAVDAAKDKAADAVDAAKDKAAETVDKAADKAADAAKGAAEDAKKKLGL